MQPDVMKPHRPLVLVADSNCESAAMISRQLLWAGYDVVTAADGNEALTVLHERDVDAAVLEVMLDGLTGYEIVRRMRSEAERQLTPIVLISARAGKLDRDFAFTCGADDYVKKPFRTADLTARLALLVPSPAAPVPPAMPRARRRPRRSALQPAFSA
jgi:DNA-binding response OmpR family regulator